jgi:hypothetical protein
MRMTSLIMLSVLLTYSGYAQQSAAPIPTSVQTQLLLDAAGPKQREAIKNIYLIVCPLSGPAGGYSAGTGFLLDTGVVVTNAHVVKECTYSNLYAITPDNQRMQFRRIVKDSGRDLAALLPTRLLSAGLKLSNGPDPLPGAEVSTWGYPFLYNDTTPLLSVGHVAGYRMDESNGTPTKHIVVNAAFNHGNSGGPLLLAQENSVIGVVVMTFHFYPPYVRQTIDEMSRSADGWFHSMKIRNADGTTKEVGYSEAQMAAIILDEFYQKTQIMIGEAISASEVNAMLKEHTQELRP